MIIPIQSDPKANYRPNKAKVICTACKFKGCIGRCNFKASTQRPPRTPDAA
jgi:hypothetical protein